MKNSKTLLPLAALLLIAGAVWIGVSQLDRGVNLPGKHGGHRPGQKRGRPDTGTLGGGTTESAAAGAKTGERADQDRPSKPVVPVSGLGSIPFSETRKRMNFNEILHRCGLISDGEYERRLKNGSKAEADVYLNDKGEIVHICYQKGLYKTKSRDVEAMAFFRDDPRGGPTLEIDDFGVPGLTLDNSKMLSGFLEMASIGATVSSSASSFELEVTPVMVKVTGGYRDNPLYAKYVGRILPMILIKSSTGTPYASAQRVDYVDYPRTDIVRRDWRLTTFLPDPERENGSGMEVSGGKVWDELRLEAWERRQAGSATGQARRGTGE